MRFLPGDRSDDVEEESFLQGQAPTRTSFQFLSLTVMNILIFTVSVLVNGTRLLAKNPCDRNDAARATSSYYKLPSINYPSVILTIQAPVIETSSMTSHTMHMNGAPFSPSAPILRPHGARPLSRCSVGLLRAPSSRLLPYHSRPRPRSR